jgi:hypothetical protein
MGAYTTLTYLVNNVLPKSDELLTTNPVTGAQEVKEFKPWLNFPPGGISFSPQASIPIPSVGSGFVPVLTLVVPQGNDGVINRIHNNFTGGGFVEGSGDIVWQITINGRAVKNYDQILTEKGSTQWLQKIAPIRIYSGQTIQYLVNHVNNPLLSNGFIICGFSGYFYPNTY